MRHRLIETSKALNIGKSQTFVDEHGEIQRKVVNSKDYEGVKLLVDSDNRPEFHANAFLLSLRLSDGLKDIAPSSKAMLIYFRFLSVNNIRWDDVDSVLDRKPIFLFRNHLNKMIAEGSYRRTTASSYLAVVRKFYLFCYRHGYIEQLPFLIEGVNKYGKNYTDCTIKSPSNEKGLRPLIDRELSYVSEHWSVVSIEFRLIILLALNSGLRAVEASDIKQRLFKIPKDFEGNTVTGIRIGPSNNCKTKFDIDREITMPVWLIKLFNRYHNSQRYKKRAAEYCELTGSYDVPAVLTKNSDVFSTKTITALWNKLSKQIQEESDPHFNHNFHENRATFGCRKLDALLSIEGITQSQALATLKAELGHKQIESTWRYLAYWEGHPEQNISAQVMMGLDDVFLQDMEF
ncbi:TPA: site-specific integrase [Citrobacter braakii]|jgi:integrase|nr:site-specific integrase [Citrobacter braakii]HDL4325290.1 site-specific integrase [Escherichia coli]